MERRRAFLVLAAAFAGGCGSSSDGNTGGTGGSGGNSGDVTPWAMMFCAKLDACPGETPNPSCEAEASALVLSAECQQRLLDAPCADILSPSLQGCFPACYAPNTATCNPDGSITLCTHDGFEATAMCAGVCSAQSKSWTGVCGPSYNGVPSSTGSSVCWCQ